MIVSPIVTPQSNGSNMASQKKKHLGPPGRSGHRRNGGRWRGRRGADKERQEKPARPEARYEVKRTTAGTAWAWIRTPPTCGAGPTSHKTGTATGPLLLGVTGFKVPGGSSQLPPPFLGTTYVIDINIPKK